MKRAMELPDDADACETEKYAFIIDVLKMAKNDPEWDLDKMSEKLLGLVYGSVANTPIVASNVILHILRDQNDVQSRVQQEVIVDIAVKCKQDLTQQHLGRPRLSHRRWSNQSFGYIQYVFYRILHRGVAAARGFAVPYATNDAGNTSCWNLHHPPGQPIGDCAT